MSNGINHLNKPIKVAFLLIGGRQWMGGYNYLLNLLSVIKDDARIQPVLFLGNDIDKSLLLPLEKFGYKIIYDDEFNSSTKHIKVAKAIIFGKNHQIEKIFLDNKIDIVFEAAMYLGWNTTIPRLSWLPDFQHRQLPYMFSKIGWIKREIVYRLIAKNRFIMLSSLDAKKDYNKFYGVPKHDLKVIPFAVKKPTINAESVDAILEKYNIKQPYFYLPNQFWKHKNHVIAIEALNQLKYKNSSILVVTSGHCEDARILSYCNTLKDLLDQYDVKENFHMLGSIPYEDVLSLMSLSCAVINPSLFEGWSTTVEEAKSLKVPLILSNLSVHKEQVEENAIFFDPNNSLELSEILISYECKDNGKVDYGLSQTKRLENYGDNFIGAVTSVLNKVTSI